MSKKVRIEVELTEFELGSIIHGCLDLSYIQRRTEQMIDAGLPDFTGPQRAAAARAACKILKSAKEWAETQVELAKAGTI